MPSHAQKGPIEPDERALEFFLRKTPDMFCIADTEGYFRYLSPAWKETLGYSLQELRSRPYTAFIHPQDRGGTVQEAGRAAQDQATRCYENRYIHRNGRVVWLSWNSTVDAERALIYAVARDVTHRVQGEEGRLRLHQNIAHDMAAPVSAMRLHIMTAHEKGEMRDATFAFLHRNLARLERLVGDARDVGRIHSGRLDLSLRELDLARVVSEAAANMHPVAEARQIRIVVDASPSPVRGDPDRLGQVVTNLLHNAIKFSPAGSRIDLACRSVEGRAEASVCDEGPGISRQDARLLFEPFTQLENAAHGGEKGTGLGLYISKGLVEAHGGSIGVEGGRQGACFWFQVPLRG